jgi:flagellar biosynthesis/type III secretory pathway M-ring protein FliF/YscJ
MEKQNNSKKTQNKQISILSMLFNKADRDTTYKSDLFNQWSQMDTPQRFQFIIGSFVGLVLFFGSLFLVFLLLSRLFG